MDVARRVLYALRIKGMAPVPVVCELAEVPEDEALAALTSLASDGLVSERSGAAMSGWVLLPGGRAWLDEALAGGSRDDELHTLYTTSFLPINARFKQLCTDWQALASDDPEREDLIADLAELHVEAKGFLSAAGPALRLSEVHTRRLGRALQALQDGDARYFTGVLVESYHGVWFELHEDLMLSLGIDRAAEETAET
jgi:hypothetical protein